MRKQERTKVYYMKAFLILEDGTTFTGTSIGSTKEVISEIQAGLQEGMRELEKALFIHDYIVKNVHLKEKL